MFVCGNKQFGTHYHVTADEGRTCTRLVAAIDAKPSAWHTGPAHPPAPSPTVIPNWCERMLLPTGNYFTFGRKDHPEGPLSWPQFQYITGGLKGDLEQALACTYAQASVYIDNLKGNSRRTPMTAGSWTDPKLDLIKGLIELVPDGYFAVQEYDGGHVDFIRVSSPTSGQYKGARKFQTVHGSGIKIKLVPAATLWPGGRWSVYKDGFVEKLMLLCTDYHSAAMRYGEKMRRCCRCNAELTDGRSRWYNIGPDCEDIWTWVVPQVDETKGVFAGVR